MDELADCYDSWLIGGADVRELFKLKSAGVENFKDFRASFNDERRASLSNNCLRAWEAADRIRAADPEIEEKTDE